MTKDDENELHRLCNVLRTLHEKAGGDARATEALRKAGVALSVGFARGLRSEIEQLYAKLDSPLTVDERTHLARMNLPSGEKKDA